MSFWEALLGTTIDMALVREQLDMPHRAFGLLVQLNEESRCICYLADQETRLLTALTKYYALDLPLSRHEISPRQLWQCLAWTRVSWPSNLLPDELFSHAAALQASDIHIDAEEDHYSIRLRLDGVLESLVNLDRTEGFRLVEAIKVAADIDIGQKHAALDGQFSRTYYQQRIDFRVASIPSVDGDSLAIRILDPNCIVPNLDVLFPRQADELREALRCAEGLVVVAGPTGAGKSTSLQAIVEHLNNGDRLIVTLENPVERRFVGVRQCDVSQRDQPAWLRSALRQDPDVLMIGEIRDAQTAELAVQAARSGHLVLTTIHIAHKTQLYQRFCELQVAQNALKEVLRLLIVQRLVRQSCKHCNAMGYEQCRNRGYQ